MAKFKVGDTIVTTRDYQTSIGTLSKGSIIKIFNQDEGITEFTILNTYKKYCWAGNLHLNENAIMTTRALEQSELK